MRFVLGVDGGNTKTLALIAGEEGVILGKGRAGCSDIYGAKSPAAAMGEIEQAVHAALAEAGIRPDEIAAGVFSMAGADWPEDFQLLNDALCSRGYGRTIQVVNDAIGALRAGSPDGTGVAVACGSGAAVGARHSDGRVWHSSFWQQTQGAGELSHKALRAVYRAELGIDPPTTLTEKILSAFEAGSVEEVLHRMTAHGLPRPENVRHLVRPLFEAAEAGDAAAQQILIAHGESLGDYAVVAARKVGLLDTSFPLVLTGGVLRNPSHFLREALIERVREAAPCVGAVQSRFEPAAGAVLLALDLVAVHTDATLFDRLESTQPGALFFET